jgi:hypothetical protein
VAEVLARFVSRSIRPVHRFTEFLTKPSSGRVSVPHPFSSSIATSWVRFVPAFQGVLPMELPQLTDDELIAIWFQATAEFAPSRAKLCT